MIIFHFNNYLSFVFLIRSNKILLHNTITINDINLNRMRLELLNNNNHIKREENTNKIIKRNIVHHTFMFLCLLLVENKWLRIITETVANDNWQFVIENFKINFYIVGALTNSDFFYDKAPSHSIINPTIHCTYFLMKYCCNKKIRITLWSVEIYFIAKSFPQLYSIYFLCSVIICGYYFAHHSTSWYFLYSLTFILCSTEQKNNNTKQWEKQRQQIIIKIEVKSRSFAMRRKRRMVNYTG